MTSGLPAIDVVMTGRPMTYASRAERDSRWPNLAGTPSRVEAVAALPLSVGGRTLGCLAIGFAEERRLEVDDLDFSRRACRSDRHRSRAGSTHRSRA